MKKHYFNTNNESPDLFSESNIKAKTQEEKIIEVFKMFNASPLSAEDVQEILQLDNVPLTSIRRAISNIANPRKWNLIEKTDKMVRGQYGKQINTWILKPVSDVR